MQITETNPGRFAGSARGRGQAKHRSLRAFTLVEVMIVVALIALLAAIAVPNFLRARKRAQATRILSDLRMVDAAIDLYAIERGKANGAEVTWTDVQPYLKTNSALYNSGGQDLLGHEFGLSIGDVGAKVANETYQSLADVVPVEFWSPFK